MSLIKAVLIFWNLTIWSPATQSKIVMTSAWFNEMKGDLTLKEFKGSVVQLYNYWFKGIKIKKKKFRYWYRLNP